MDNKNVILKTHELEVIGDGPMVYTPCQIGEWWVMPAEQYTGTIPPEIQAKWDNFKALNIPVVGYLIADDMRVDAAERQRKVLEHQQRKEQFDRTVHEVAEVNGKVLAGAGAVAVGVLTVGGAVIAGLALGAVAAIGALLRFDPILIAVLPDGRWICLGAWWD